MNLFPDGLAPLASAIVQGLINSLWQGLLLVVVVWVMLRVWKGAAAATRHAVWWATLVILLLLPLAGLFSGGEVPQSSQVSAQILPSNHAPDGSQAVGQYPLAAIQLHAGQWLILLLGVWIVLAALNLARIARGFAHISKLKQSHAELPAELRTSIQSCIETHGVGRRVNLMVSDKAPSPMLVGFLTPSIVFPQKLIGELTSEEFEQVALHELAHLRRWDDWTNLLVRCIEALFFFHPAVKWVARRVHLEREIACDDWVVSLTGRSRSYAACLAKLAGLAVPPKPPALAAGAILGRRGIAKRIDLLLERRSNPTTHISWKGIIVALSMIGVAVIQIIHTPTVVAVVPNPPPVVFSDQNPSPDVPDGIPSPPAPPDSFHESPGLLPEDASGTPSEALSSKRGKGTVTRILAACREIFENCDLKGVMACVIPGENNTRTICVDPMCKRRECLTPISKPNCSIVFCTLAEFDSD